MLMALEGYQIVVADATCDRLVSITPLFKSCSRHWTIHIVISFSFYFIAWTYLSMYLPHLSIRRLSTLFVVLRALVTKSFPWDEKKSIPLYPDASSLSSLPRQLNDQQHLSAPTKHTPFKCLGWVLQSNVDTHRQVIVWGAHSGVDYYSMETMCRNKQNLKRRYYPFAFSISNIYLKWQCWMFIPNMGQFSDL